MSVLTGRARQRLFRARTARGAILAAVLLAGSLAGCALLGRGEPSIGAAMEGTLEQDVYTSPQKNFRVRLPRLAQESTVREQTLGADTVTVTIADELCREFIVSQRPGFLGAQSLAQWVDAHIVEDLKQLGFAVQARPAATRAGPVIVLRYRAPAAAPCSRSGADGQAAETKLDADVGWYIFHREGLFYRVIYVVGIGPQAPSLWYVNREPVDEILAQFVEGLEILRDKAP